MPKLYPYQKEGVRKIERFNGRALLADEMGLGKSLQALWYLKRGFDERLPAIIVCPANVKWHWEREALGCLRIRPSILEGQKPRKLSETTKLVVINYDILSYWIDELRSLKPQTIVIDECQLTANQTKRTRAVRALCRKIPNIVALSGTPLLNRPMEMFNTLSILRKDLFAQRFPFGQRYCGANKTFWGWEYKGATHIDELRTILVDNVMIRRRKADVLDDLPDKVRNIVPVPIMRPEEYREASQDFLVWLQKNKPAKVRSAEKAKRLVQIGYLLRLAAKLKLRAVVEWVNQILRETDEKIVLFAIHRKMVEALRRRVESKSVVIDGKTPRKQRRYAVEQFRRDPKVRVFIGNVHAAGVGLDGLQIAQTMAFTELAWRPGDHTQAEDRLHRIGQKDVTFINYLVAHDTIEATLCDVIRKKQRVIDKTLDGKGDNKEDEFDVFDELLERLKQGETR